MLKSSPSKGSLIAVLFSHGTLDIANMGGYKGSLGLPVTRSSGREEISSIPEFTPASVYHIVVYGTFFLWLVDMFNKRYVLAGIDCLLGLGTLAYSSIRQRWLILPCLILFAPAPGGSLPLRGALVMEYFGSASCGRVIRDSAWHSGIWWGYRDRCCRLGIRYRGKSSSRMTFLCRDERRSCVVRAAIERHPSGERGMKLIFATSRT
jgi:hypothetical protein